MVSCWNCWHELLCKPCLPPCHNIPPPSLTTSNIVVADTSITAIGALMVNLDISHSDPNELEAVLVGPDGTRETLFSRPLGLRESHQTSAFNGKPLSDTRTLELCDPVKGDTGMLNSWSLTVARLSQNVAPAAADDRYSIKQGNTLSMAAPGVLANDSDPNNDPLTALLDVGPVHGSLTLNPNGSFSCTPTSGYFGSESFTYRVQDGQGGVDTGTIFMAIADSTPVRLLINDGSKTEGTNGSTVFTFTVTRSVKQGTFLGVDPRRRGIQE